MVVEIVPALGLAGDAAAQGIEGRYGPQLALCYQCKRCTAGCPVADLMDYRPHQIMRLVRLGAVDRALSSDAIWACVGCYACTTRCPQGVPVTEMMYALKSEALRRGLTPANATVPAFVRSFAATVERHGRNRETEMLARYYLSTGPLEALKEARVGLTLLRQGRLPLLGHRTRGWGKARQMLRRAKTRGRAGSGPWLAAGGLLAAGLALVWLRKARGEKK